MFLTTYTRMNRKPPISLLGEKRAGVVSLHVHGTVYDLTTTLSSVCYSVSNTSISSM